MPALRALRELTEQARQARLDAAERCMAFDIYAAWAARYPADTVLEWARQRIDGAEAEAQRQGWREIVQILERPTVEVVR